MDFAALGIAFLALGIAVYAARQSRNALLLADEAYDMADCAGELTIAVGVYAVRDEPVEFEIIEADLFGLTET